MAQGNSQTNILENGKPTVIINDKREFKHFKCESFKEVGSFVAFVGPEGTQFINTNNIVSIFIKEVEE